MIRLRDSFNAGRGRELLARSQVLRRSWPVVLDFVVAILGLACFYGVVRVGRYYAGHAVPEIAISQSALALPRYALLSVIRIGLAYLLSLVFAIAYGYIAAYSRRLEGLMLAVLDILQSIPVLSFLPGVMLAMVALFPTRQIGIEFGAILLIFTGQVWNIAFSFYSSVKSIPAELVEATEIYRYSRVQRFLDLELPYAAIGLIWNSIMSVAGAWFFLMACEMFQLGQRDFRLPGLGSYLQTAASNGNGPAMLYGLLAMILIIVVTDQLLWRPVIAWSDRFKFEQTESSTRVRSPLLELLRGSRLANSLLHSAGDRVSEVLYQRSTARAIQGVELGTDTHRRRSRRRAWVRGVALALVSALTVVMAVHAFGLLRTLHRYQIAGVLRGALLTLLRVALALLLALLWTVPAGVSIGSHPRLARIAQPLAQIAASVPATALFPVLLLALLRIGGGMGVGSVALMLLGTQWYILFNVIAGAMAIPSDLKEVARLYGFGTVQRWRTVILPGIFPYLLTGLITASGGAWNASIVAEYFPLKKQILETSGLGNEISAATASGQFQVLLLATIVMALMVVTINRLVWRPLFRLAESRYKLGA